MEKMKILRPRDANYPLLLKEIAKPPTLYYKGSLEKDGRPHVAIVGTRRATSPGKSAAKEIAKYLAANGVVVVSGLAMGIDAAAHEGALEGRGKTIAVLATGLDRIYPPQNTGLAEKILGSGGTIFSEYVPGTPSYPNQFLERNRIVSGLCLGIVVVEAPEKSGALSTASHALEQNREVFVVPGPVNNPNYAGSHALLRAGARLVTSAAEILDDLNLARSGGQQSLLSEKNSLLNENQKAVLVALRSAGEAASVDKISVLAKMDVSAVNRNLTLLLIQGIVKEEGGRYFLAI